MSPFDKFHSHLPAIIITALSTMLTLLLLQGQPAEAQNYPITRVTSASATLTAGTNALSTGSEALGTAQQVWECLIQNDPDNNIDIFVGDSASQPIEIVPGASMTIPVQDIATIFVKADSGTPTINFLCR